MILKIRWFVCGLGMLALGISFWSCNLSESPSARNFLSFKLPDSLKNYDTIRIVLVNPGTSDTLEILWNGPLEDSEDLGKLPVTHYAGGDVDVVIEGIKSGVILYRELVAYRGEDVALVSKALPTADKGHEQARDTIPPELIMIGADSITLLAFDIYREPGATCVDGKDGSREIRIAGSIDATIAGEYRLDYDCEDMAGNRAKRKTRQVLVLPLQDTTPPVVTLLGADSVALIQGQNYTDPGAHCVDDKDGELAISVSGSVDTGLRQVYTLLYDCRDSSGNAASRKARQVSVEKVTDTTKPVLFLHGSDSVMTYQGQPYTDSGAECNDDRDRRLSVSVLGSVNTDMRAEYSLAFSCADSAGNQALPIIRHVQVIRTHDPIAPILTLRGPDSIAVQQGALYADLGSTCLDDRDGLLPVIVQGSVDTQLRGDYTLRFGCSDSAGNVAEVVKRSVKVIQVPDSIKPAVSLKGPDSMSVVEDQDYRDSGAVCQDDRDGLLAITVKGKVDTHARGVYLLTYGCADSTGNTAIEKNRFIKVIRAQDHVKPIVSLKGLDSVTAIEKQSYRDSGAVCQDDRDGLLPVSIKGNVNILTRGRYTLAYGCEDSAGNVADGIIRSVEVIRLPDEVKPAIVLRGKDSVLTSQGSPYVDAGADCLDDRDGARPMMMIGYVNTITLGTYPLTYDCADSAGNAAEKKVRIVRVVVPPDTTKPVVVLKGPDTMAVVGLDSFVDPGAACLDDRSESIAAIFKGFFPPPGPPDGIYSAIYECTDSTGNIGTAARVLKAGLYTQSLTSEKETTIDTLRPTWNQGLAAVLSFTKFSFDQFFSLLKFDLSKAQKNGLKSGKLHFYTYGYGPQWPGNRADYAFRIYALKSPWTEGNGNHYFYDGGWRNGGQALLGGYGIGDSIKNISVMPSSAYGVKGSDMSLIQESNIALVKTQTVNLFYGPDNVSGPVNPPGKLVVLELDITDYVKTTNPENDFGFLIKVSDIPDSRYIAFLTKEIGDGSYAPRLMLSY